MYICMYKIPPTKTQKIMQVVKIKITKYFQFHYLNLPTWILPLPSTFMYSAYIKALCCLWLLKPACT